MSANSNKISSNQKQFLLKMIKSGSTREQCISGFRKKFKRGLSYESLRKIARSANLSMSANSGVLTDNQYKFVDSLIREGVSQNDSIMKFKEKFGRTIGKDILRRRANKLGLRYSGKAKNAYSEDELSILRGAMLLGKNSTEAAKELHKIKGDERNHVGVKQKFWHLKAEGLLADNIKMEISKEMKAGKTNSDLSKRYGIHVKYIEEFRNNYLKKSEVEIKNLKRWEESDVNDVLDLIEQAQAKLGKISSEQEEANITITTNNKYVALTFISDIHLENVNTDIRQLRDDIAIIRNTPDFYVGFGGDLIDNFMVGPHKEGTVEAVIPPKQARVAAGKLFDYMKGRLLWTILGCHDAWDANYADYNLPEHIARKLRIPYLGHGGDINLTLQKNGSKKNVTYNIHARHKYKGATSSNGTATCKRVLTEISPIFDIIAVSHNHFAEIKLENYLGKQRCFIRTGSYKKEDRYSKQLGYQSSEFNAMIPVVILNTETKQMKVVSGIENAADMLRALNKK
jgi:predicted MPP superfamily phosphohydrolase